MNLTLLNQLLHRTESDQVDFKGDVYKISTADHRGPDVSDEQADKRALKAKSELIKDILAFANGWGEKPAYILMGVSEERVAGVHKVVGVSSVPDEADYRQIINGKTNRPVQFDFEVVHFDGKDIIVITVPLQRRPVFLQKSLEPFLHANAVYYRDGSSTAVADPDMVAEMGVSEQISLTTPSPVVTFMDADHNAVTQLAKEGRVISNLKREEVPDYESSGEFRIATFNSDYFRELFDFV